MTKVCSKCEEELILDMFGKDKSKKDGYNIYCKKCNREYQQNNKEKRKEYYKENIKKIKHYYNENKTQISNYRKQHYKENKDVAIEYYSKNKDIIIQNQKKYKKENKYEIAKYSRQYKQKRRAIEHNLPFTLTTHQWENAKAYFNKTCAYCGEELNLEQDHFIPLIKRGGYTKENIIPACRGCNASKYDKLFEEWYLTYKFYDKNREQYILNYIEEMKGLHKKQFNN